jgi:hypothetical protein
LLHRLLYEFWARFQTVNIEIAVKEAFRLENELRPDHEVDIVSQFRGAIVIDAKTLIEVLATFEFVWLPEERWDA